MWKLTSKMERMIPLSFSFKILSSPQCLQPLFLPTSNYNILPLIFESTRLYEVSEELLIFIKPVLGVLERKIPRVIAIPIVTIGSLLLIVIGCACGSGRMGLRFIYKVSSLVCSDANDYSFPT